jgi:hypothetical protein
MRMIKCDVHILINHAHHSHSRHQQKPPPWQGQASLEVYELAAGDIYMQFVTDCLARCIVRTMLQGSIMPVCFCPLQAREHKAQAATVTSDQPATLSAPLAQNMM